MIITAILELNRGFNLTINQGKFKIKRSKDKQKLLYNYIDQLVNIKTPLHIKL